MSAPTLAEAVAQYGRDAYLLTIANDSPHTSFVSVDLNGNVIACAVGKSAAKGLLYRLSSGSLFSGIHPPPRATISEAPERLGTTPTASRPTGVACGK